MPHAIAIKMALGTSLATIVVTAMSSIYTHHRKGAVEWRLFHVMGPAVFVGSLVGAWLADIIPGDALCIAFIVFLFAISIQMAMSRVGAHRSPPGKAGLAATSTTVGIVSALMGIGGGAMHVPFLSYCGVPVKRAIATAAAVGLLLSASATLGYIIGGLDEDRNTAGQYRLCQSAGVRRRRGRQPVVRTARRHAGAMLPDMLLRRLFAVFFSVWPVAWPTTCSEGLDPMRNANLCSFSSAFPKARCLESTFDPAADGRRFALQRGAAGGPSAEPAAEPGRGDPGDRVVVQVDKSIESVLLLSGLPACRRDLHPAEHRVHPGRGRLFSAGRGAAPVRLCAEHAAGDGVVARESGVPGLLSLDASGQGSLTMRWQPVNDAGSSKRSPTGGRHPLHLGTTGRSKGRDARVTPTSRRTRRCCTTPGTGDPTMCCCIALPIFHVHGLFVALHCALLGGSRVIFMPRFDADGVIDRLARRP